MDKSLFYLLLGRYVELNNSDIMNLKFTLFIIIYWSTDRFLA